MVGAYLLKGHQALVLSSQKRSARATGCISYQKRLGCHPQLPGLSTECGGSSQLASSCSKSSSYISKFSNGSIHGANVALRSSRPMLPCRTRKGSSSRRFRGAQAQLGLRENGATPHNRTPPTFNGVFLLILLNIALFLVDHVFKVPLVRFLYLDHSHARWYQFVTSMFCHASWSHLSSNLFALYIAGKLVEEEEGSFGVWASYLITGLGANIVSWALLPRACISVGASGAVFGLYAVSVLVKIGWDWRKILEVIILGQFVVEKVLSEVQMAANMGGAKLGAYSVNHVAHLAGALAGVALIWLITKLPAGEDGRVREKSRLP